MRARVLLPLGIVASLLPAAAMAQPGMSDVIRIDHGFRFQNPEDTNVGCAIALSETQAFLSYGTGFGSIHGYRRGLLGEEIDLTPRSIWIPYHGIGGYDFSAPDARGWKLLRTRYNGDAERGLFLHEVDSVTCELDPNFLELLSASSDRMHHHPRICSFGGLHLVACLQELQQSKRILLGRVTPAMELLPPGMIEASPTDVSRGPFGVAMGDTAGMVGWVNAAGAAYVRCLNAEALPVGGQILIHQGAAAYLPQVALCPLGEDFLLVWASQGWAAPRWARLSADGSILPPGILSLPAGACEAGIALAGGPTGALVSWRSDFGPVLAARISLTGELLDPNPIVLAADGLVLYFEDDVLERPIDARWTGSHYMVAWNNWAYDPPRDSQAGARSDPDPRYMFKAQWIAPDGAPLFPEPVPVAQGTDPKHLSLDWMNGEFNCLVRDGYAPRLAFRVRIDSCGMTTAPATSEYADCLAYGDDFSYWAGPEICATAEDDEAAVAAIVAAHVDFHDPSYEQAIVEILPFEGGAFPEWEICWSAGEAWWSRVDGVDLELPPDRILAAYERTRLQDVGGVYVQLRNRQGDWLHTWQVDSLRESHQPVLTHLDGDAYLLLWTDERSEYQQIYRETLRMTDQLEVITGVPLMPGAFSQSQADVARGPDQYLAVYVAGVPGSDQAGIHAVRLDASGAPIDSLPLSVRLPDDAHCIPRVAWDGRNYVVVWRTGEYAPVVWANRVSAEGQVLDGNGFLVGDGRDGHRVDVAATGTGIAAVVLSGNRLRLIYDPLWASVGDDPSAGGDPTARDDPIASDDPTAGVVRLRLSPARPNPTLGGVVLLLNGVVGETRALVHDVAGRPLVELSRDAFGPGWIAWDGRLPGGGPAPAGVYFLRIENAQGTAAQRIVVCH